ncbi:uncharacterized protein LDX57_002617 [Aspergillus melleus]|uniref:uncharacterized protein n=1 Tax=Aspergillus melleus TaxID=138277 RepID=UPI001E8E9F07|nr:uncharacterized protein LDX57_002617 [Aspergillus melleus]KAH8424873.1 hypothetical protein LDX57_002617 [Aspergillus melleus]
MNMSLALQISGRFIDLDLGQRIGQVIENQENLYSELRKSLQVFTYSIRQSVERDLERYNDWNIKTEVRMEDLYESMSTGFPSLDHIEVPAEPLFPNIEGKNDASNYTKMKVSRARTFKENDADFERVLKEFKDSSLLERLGEQTGSADLSVLLENIERQNINKQGRGFSTSKNRMLSGVNAWTNILPSQYTNTILSSYTVLLQASKASENTFELMVEGLAEASDAIRLCKREYDLYPAPEVKEAMIKLYSHVLAFGAEAAMITKKSFAGRFIHAMTFQDGPIPKLIVKIQKQARAIMQEVEYQQRLEMRDMSSRVRHIERDQQKILSGIASQRKILESLRDQQSIMSMIKTQQEILDGVQKLLLRIPA